MSQKISVMTNILEANDAWAEQNRALLQKKNIRMLNIIGSPGSGKTTLLERTADLLKGTVFFGVIEGDLATTKDAKRLQKKNVPVIQINTGTACHLDAHMVHQALQGLLKKQPKLQLIFVENIGNLVCPAEFDIGETAKIAVLSVTEGDDKIPKYPLLFSSCKALVITKLDLLRHTNFSVAAARKEYRKVNVSKKQYLLDSISGKGTAEWVSFVRSFVQEK